MNYKDFKANKNIDYLDITENSKEYQYNEILGSQTSDNNSVSVDQENIELGCQIISGSPGPAMDMTDDRV